VEEAQLLKFGRLVDVEKLEKLGSNRIADELRQKLDKITSIQNHELEAWQAKIVRAQNDYTELVRDNTAYLTKMADIAQQTLQERVKGKHLQKEQHHAVVISEAEKVELLKEIQDQEGEIEDLKTQISELLRK
jgi:hypothetical protein